jgi:EmrB/QacA subfamily drug resistance transporter
MEQESASSRKWLCFVSVALGTFMAYVDTNVVNIALPVMARDFQVDLGVIKWVVTAYLLMVTSLVLIFGRVADLYGRKRLYLFGIVTFTLGSALSSIAPTIWLLTVFRCLTGIGGAALMANGSAILTESFPAEERGRALGSLGSIVAVAALVGPLLGGFLSEHFGWRAIFYISIPAGIGGSLLGAKAIPSGRGERRREHFDFSGAVTLVAALGCFLFLTNALSQTARSAPMIATLLMAAVALALAFLVIERRVEHPLLDLTLFHSRAFSAAVTSSFLSFWALSVLSFLLPFYLDRVLGFAPSKIGAIFAPVPLVLLVAAPLGGHLADKFGARMVCTMGAVVNLFSLLGLSTMGTETSALGVILRLIPFGLGSGLFTPPNNSAIMGAVPRSRLGIASGMISALKSLGSMSGVAVTSLIFSIVQVAAMERLLAGGVTNAQAEQQSFASAVSLLFMISATLAAVVIVTSLVRGGKPVEEEEKAVATAEA